MFISLSLLPNHITHSCPLEPDNDNRELQTILSPAHREHRPQPIHLSLIICCRAIALYHDDDLELALHQTTGLLFQFYLLLR